MSSENWTLSSELCKLTNTVTEAGALYALNMLPDPELPYQIRMDDNWIRGGAETYIFRFWISTAQHEEKGYIIKACVSLDFEKGIEGVLNDWLSRRDLLDRNGVTVPKLFFSGQGLIIEEIIPWTLRAYMQSHPDILNNLLPLMVDYVSILSNLGFLPVDGFSDLRTHGQDVVVVDFGQDLGPPRMNRDLKINLLDILLDTVWHWGLLTKRELSIELHERYLRRQKLLPRTILSS